ncbi:MAG TPA: hypothetical protein VLT85_01495 [Terriglobales bacterium]|nr:hypothetical protein [Terriglobales bacterium]
MGRLLGVSLAAWLTAGPAVLQTPPDQAPPTTPEPTLQAGVSQYDEGDIAGSVFTLETVIRSLAVEPEAHAKDLSQAYLYRGAAFVRLSQEENAKGSFAAALQYDKDLRITEEKWPPRVVRVFEAARAGKTKSVLLPPSHVAKKAGIGALGIAGIVGGALAVGGGVAVASHSSSQPQPTPTPTPVPTPTPALFSPIESVGKVTIVFVAASPAIGSTIPVKWSYPIPSNVLQLAVDMTSTTGTITAYLMARLEGSCGASVWLVTGDGFGKSTLQGNVPVREVFGTNIMHIGTCGDTFTTTTAKFCVGQGYQQCQTYQEYAMPFTWNVTR